MEYFDVFIFTFQTQVPAIKSMHGLPPPPFFIAWAWSYIIIVVIMISYGECNKISSLQNRMHT